MEAMGCKAHIDRGIECIDGKDRGKGCTGDMEAFSSIGACANIAFVLFNSNCVHCSLLSNGSVFKEVDLCNDCDKYGFDISVIVCSTAVWGERARYLQVVAVERLYVF